MIRNPISIQDIVQDHQRKVLSGDTSDIFRITVRRRHVWDDALATFKRGFPFTSHIRITFVGEPAVDAGGPCREFLCILMQECMRNNNLFEGPDNCRIPVHNMAELEKRTFKYIGQMIAVSVVQGGPGPQCLSPAVVDYLSYGIEKILATSEDVPDTEIKYKLKMVCEIFFAFTRVIYNILYSWKMQLMTLLYKVCLEVIILTFDLNVV